MTSSHFCRLNDVAYQRHLLYVTNHKTILKMCILKKRGNNQNKLLFCQILHLVKIKKKNKTLFYQ